MASDKIPNLGQFDTLFNKNVPHILEKIFFSLDYDSFETCTKVCTTWDELLSSESYQNRSREMLDEQTGEEIGKLLETLKIARNAEIARKTEIADPRSRSKL